MQNTSSMNMDNGGGKRRATPLCTRLAVPPVKKRSLPITEEEVLLVRPSPISTAITAPTEENVEGLYLDDGEEGEQEEIGEPGFLPTSIPLCALPTIRNGPVELEAANDSGTTAFSAQPVNARNRILWTGIVVEDGAQHFDRRLHRERPARISSIVAALKVDGVLDKCCLVESNARAESFLKDEDYLRVHLPGYMKRLSRIDGCTCACSREMLDREAEQYQSVYFTNDSVAAAKQAASSLCALVEQAVTTAGSVANGFAIIRPPGHHAEKGLAGGYCILNNVAIAAAYARAKLGSAKILIVDWDVHFGNGTQAIFLNDPNVLYFSVHRYNGGTFFPFSKAASPTQVGGMDAEGYTINVGWSRKGMGNAEYASAWEKILLPVTAAFDPDLVLVSAGFDAARGDMGECNVTPTGFAHLTRRLKSTLSTIRPEKPAPIVCALEGGYVRSVLGKCVSAVVSALLEDNVTVSASSAATVVGADSPLTLTHLPLLTFVKRSKSIAPFGTAYLYPMNVRVRRLVCHHDTVTKNLQGSRLAIPDFWVRLLVSRSLSGVLIAGLLAALFYYIAT